ncbi:prepilin-type N-terminal cleavage/methylation domain-containing protein [Amphritea balenae]|uniref:Prepilin-type N-terminal cleavage/methylation domain-containing protein n=1 Tax=Amphritea balenae TaxID=452629 RepID=A0A3P1SIT4_9GAMM|nr:prepilin-type N-terminal cleavage/methylation domain-containing protein [Amphritea balenae]RRC96789.1 prepilin-type N-terminal cleavage/methylation domain-containing protein [Amphritea balenae]GGK84852.1 hypothetical protein GCM10007941_39230 [Amphritea balenae]
MNGRTESSREVSRQRGFTLLELLIALVLSGLIMALVFGGLSIAIRSWETVGQRSEHISEAFTLQHFLRQQLMGVSDERVASLEEGTLVVGFYGLENELIFTGFLNADDQGKLLTWIYLRVNTEDLLKPRLQLSTAPFDNVEEVDWEQMLADFRTESTSTYTLLQGTLQQIRFEYFEDEPDGQGQWHSEWRDRYALPKLIRLSFEMTDSQPLDWPEIIVVPREHSYVIKSAT